MSAHGGNCCPPVAVVTGSSSGIGRAVAVEFAWAGYRVLLHGRKPSEQLDAVEQELQAIQLELSTADQNGNQVWVEKIYGDFSQPIDWQQFVDDAWSKLGPVDCWVNNAGGDVLTNDWKDRPIEEKLDYLWKTDVTASLMLSRHAGRRMIADRQKQLEISGNKPTAVTGSIVNIGWDQADQGMEGDSGELFATTKGAITAMTKSLAQSLAPQIRVNCIAPGWIQTAWGQGAPEAWQRRAKQESLMNRWGLPKDVAAAVVFLCQAEASFISGQVLPVNGGFRFGFN